MLAIIFLEWCNSSIWGLHIEEIKRVMDFYSQPFKPELITELFEGFYPTSDEDVFCINFETSNPAFKGNAYNKVELFKGSHYEISNVFAKLMRVDYPETLDNFISDCSRFGIELTFNQETVNKYFK